MLGEIYAYGLRNPQNLRWDMRTGRLFVADIGEATVEEINVVAPGANLGWDHWEGSFRLRSGEGTFHQTPVISLRNPRADAAVTYPVIEFDQRDPLFMKNSSAVTGPIVYRHHAIPHLTGSVLFGELVSGEVFFFSAEDLPDGGQDGIRRVLLRHDGEIKSFLRMVEEKVAAQNQKPKGRTDLRFGTGPDGQLFLLNKHDNTIRRLVAVEYPLRSN